MSEEKQEKYEIPNRTAIAVDLIRISNLLKNNQLIQANGLAQKLEGIVLEIVSKDVKSANAKPEFHILWPIFHRLNRIQSLCLSGKTGLAYTQAKESCEILGKI